MEWKFSSDRRGNGPRDESSDLRFWRSVGYLILPHTPWISQESPSVIKQVTCRAGMARTMFFRLQIGIVETLPKCSWGQKVGMGWWYTHSVVMGTGVLDVIIVFTALYRVIFTELLKNRYLTGQLKCEGLLVYGRRDLLVPGCVRRRK